MFVNIKVLLLASFVFFVPVLSMTSETGTLLDEDSFQDLFALRNHHDQKSAMPAVATDQKCPNTDSDPFILDGVDEAKNTVLHRSVLRSNEAGWDKDAFSKTLDRFIHDINTPNKIGATALHIACSMNAYDVVRMLLKSGADVNIAAEGNLFPLHYVFLPIYAYRPRVYDLEFYEDGVMAEVHPFKPYGRTFFEIREMMREEILKELVQAFNDTLVLQAANKKRNQKRLRQFGTIAGGVFAEMYQGEVDKKRKRKEEFNNQKNDDFKAADHRAATIIQTLIKESKGPLKADVKTACDGNTPLHLAVDSNFAECVRVLVEEGCADINSMNIYGKTPLDRAQEHGFGDIVQFLLQHNAKNGAMHSSHHDPSPEDDQEAIFCD